MKNADLEIAAAQGDAETVKQLLTEENMDAVNDSGYSLVHWAAQEGKIEVLKLLAEKGADMNPSQPWGITPLINAAGEGNLEVVKVLLDLGAEVSLVTRQGSALHNAVHYNHVEIVRFLIDCGADLNAVDDEGRTPLFDAVIKGRNDLVQLLVKNGAREDWRDNDGNLPGEATND